MSKPVFNDVSSSPVGSQIWQAMRDYVLIGFADENVNSQYPPNTIECTFSPAAPTDCQLIAEYSAGGGDWYPLSFADTTDGATGAGVIHFEVPRHWAKTRTWDPTIDIGGGAPGSGPLAYWIRIQRRNSDAAEGGATITNLRARCRPFIVAKRRFDDPFYEYTDDEVGTPIWFRFVSVGGDGIEHTETDVRVETVIKGFSGAPGNAF